MSRRAVIAHCWTGTPEAGWYPQARAALEALGISTQVPALPDSDQPQPEAWHQALATTIGDADENLLLVGHSLGAVALLHWLARASETTRVGAVLLVAPPIHATGIAEVDRFLAPPPDLAAARLRAQRIDAIASIADPYLRPDPLLLSRRLRVELGASVQLLPDRGHFAPSSGQDPLPELSAWASDVIRTPPNHPDSKHGNH